MSFFLSFIMKKFFSLLNYKCFDDPKIKISIIYFFSIFFFLIGLICTSIVITGLIRGYIIFGTRGELRCMKALDNYRFSEIDVRRNEIIDTYLRSSLDEDFALSSNDIYHLNLSTGMYDNK